MSNRKIKQLVELHKQGIKKYAHPWSITKLDGNLFISKDTPENIERTGDPANIEIESQWFGPKKKTPDQIKREQEKNNRYKIYDDWVTKVHDLYFKNKHNNEQFNDWWERINKDHSVALPQRPPEIGDVAPEPLGYKDKQQKPPEWASPKGGGEPFQKMYKDEYGQISYKPRTPVPSFSGLSTKQDKSIFPENYQYIEIPGGGKDAQVLWQMYAKSLPKPLEDLDKLFTKWKQDNKDIEENELGPLRTHYIEYAKTIDVHRQNYLRFLIDKIVKSKPKMHKEKYYKKLLYWIREQINNNNLQQTIQTSLTELQQQHVRRIQKEKAEREQNKQNKNQVNPQPKTSQVNPFPPSFSGFQLIESNLDIQNTYAKYGFNNILLYIEDVSGGSGKYTWNILYADLSFTDKRQYITINKCIEACKQAIPQIRNSISKYNNWTQWFDYGGYLGPEMDPDSIDGQAFIQSLRKEWNIPSTVQTKQWSENDIFILMRELKHKNKLEEHDATSEALNRGVAGNVDFSDPDKIHQETSYLRSIYRQAQSEPPDDDNDIAMFDLPEPDEWFKEPDQVMNEIKQPAQAPASLTPQLYEPPPSHQRIDTPINPRLCLDKVRNTLYIQYMGSGIGQPVRYYFIDGSSIRSPYETIDKTWQDLGDAYSYQAFEAITSRYSDSRGNIIDDNYVNVMNKYMASIPKDIANRFKRMINTGLWFDKDLKELTEEEEVEATKLKKIRENRIRVNNTPGRLLRKEVNTPFREYEYEPNLNPLTRKINKGMKRYLDENFWIEAPPNEPPLSEAELKRLQLDDESIQKLKIKTPSKKKKEPAPVVQTNTENSESKTIDRSDLTDEELETLNSNIELVQEDLKKKKLYKGPATTRKYLDLPAVYQVLVDRDRNFTGPTVDPFPKKVTEYGKEGEPGTRTQAIPAKEQETISKIDKEKTTRPEPEELPTYETVPPELINNGYADLHVGPLTYPYKLTEQPEIDIDPTTQKLVKLGTPIIYGDKNTPIDIYAPSMGEEATEPAFIGMGVFNPELFKMRKQELLEEANLDPRNKDNSEEDKASIKIIDTGCRVQATGYITGWYFNKDLILIKVWFPNLPEGFKRSMYIPYDQLTMERHQKVLEMGGFKHPKFGQPRYVGGIGGPDVIVKKSQQMSIPPNQQQVPPVQTGSQGNVTSTSGTPIQMGDIVSIQNLQSAATGSTSGKVNEIKPDGTIIYMNDLNKQEYIKPGQPVNVAKPAGTP